MLLLLIASVLTITAAVDFSVTVPDGSVLERLGSSAVLPCGLSPSLNAKTFEIRWNRNDDDNPALLYKDLKVQENIGDPQYRGRVSLVGELEKGNVSLKLVNLTLADRGQYVCSVKSVTWYDSAKVNLTIEVLGSSPLITLAEVGDELNVTCASGGWSPKPTLIWRDKEARDLTNSHTQYRTESEGLVSVSSWLLFSPSESEWISCSVGLSDQEMKEGRILPILPNSTEGYWREAFISTLVLLLIFIIILIALLLLIRRGLFQQYLSPKHKPTAEEKHPLTGSQPSAPPGSPEGRLQVWNELKEQKETLTVDPDTCNKPLTTTEDGTGVYRGNLSRYDVADSFPHVLSKEGFSSGQKYWEVKVDQKEKSKKSWCVGVTQKPPTKETLTALYYDESCGIYTSTDPRTEIPAEDHVSILGLLLDFKHKTLSFYNVDKQSHLHTLTMNNMNNNTYCALISPGVKEKQPVSFHN